MDETCNFCLKSGCPFGQNFLEKEECVFNLIIYEDDFKILFFNLPEKRLFKIQTGKGIRELNFKEMIREIDTIPRQKPEWKRVQILKLAKELGFFGIN